MGNDDESISDRSRPGLATTASSVARAGTCENFGTAAFRKNNKKREEEGE